MNKFLLITIILFVFYSCRTDTKNTNFTIKGNISNASNQTLFLSEFGNMGFKNIDSTLIEENGDFSLKGHTSIPNFFALRIAPNEFITLLIDSADILKVNTNANNFTEDYKISSTPSMDLLESLHSKLADTHSKIDSLSRIFVIEEGKENFDSIRQNLNKEFDKISKSQKDFSTNFIINNTNSMACLIALEQKLTEKKPVFSLQNDLAIFEKLDSALSKLYPNSQHVKLLHKVIARFKKQQIKQEQQSVISYKIGDILPDISLKTLTGEDINLYSLRGKYVLVDFWASWCKPCRQNNKLLAETYNNYNKKNFSILQISIDKEKEMWKDAIDKDGISKWYHASDLLFWQSKAVKKYGFKSIPFNYLINPEGKIIAINLHGDKLKNKLKQLL